VCVCGKGGGDVDQGGSKGACPVCRVPCVQHIAGIYMTCSGTAADYVMAPLRIHTPPLSHGVRVCVAAEGGGGGLFAYVLGVIPFTGAAGGCDFFVWLV